MTIEFIHAPMLVMEAIEKAIVKDLLEIAEEDRHFAIDCLNELLNAAEHNLPYMLPGEEEFLDKRSAKQLLRIGSRILSLVLD